MSERARLVLALGVVALLGAGLFALGQGEPITVTPDELGAAQAALAAWGEWAGDGDIAHVESVFADGPQLAQLRREDRAIVPGEPYRFRVTEGELVEPGLVRATVVVRRPGETEQRFHWDIEFVLHNGEWRLWTVRTSP